MADDNSTEIFLIYEYQQFFDTTRHLVKPAWKSLDAAKEDVLRRGQERWQFIQDNDGRYYSLGDGEFIDRWREEDGEWIYEFAQTNSVTLTGEWKGGWARWAIAPWTLKDKPG